MPYRLNRRIKPMISNIFIHRPRLAAVISIVITLAGFLALMNIPVAQYPQITPPEITVSAVYPGASSEVLAQTVAAPLEKEVNGVANMLYMSSTSSDTGNYTLRVTFEVGSDPDINQVNLQNRIQLATPKLPAEVVSQGISVRKRSGDMMAAVSFYSPNKTRDRLFLSNYLSDQVKDALVRINGVSDVMIFGEQEYSLRIWMNPKRLTSLKLTADDIIGAVRSQNVQASLGTVGMAPLEKEQAVQFSLRAKGRLTRVSEFEDIILRTNDQGGLVRLKDVARVELAAKSYATESILNGNPATTLAVYRSSDANALETMENVRAELGKIQQTLPEDVAYEIILDTTRYVSAAIDEIIFTLALVSVLVIAVIFVFLQDWRATLIPSVAIPVSLIGTFGILMALGYNANTITLFALIMAIGLVVDDAIVVVENVHRVMHEEDLSGPAATRKAMGQVVGPIISTTLVLFSVFVPVAFMPGITGQLYRQFAVTMCSAVLLSATCALTLSPALCATILKSTPLPARGPYAWFNRLVDLSRRGYVAGSGWMIRRLVVPVLLFAGVVTGAVMLFNQTPTSFLPPEDQGYFLINVQLPQSATLARTARVLNDITREMRAMDGVDNVIGVSGFSLLSGSAANVGFSLAILKPWDERRRPHQQLDAIVGQAQAKLAAMPDASAFAFSPPPISGLGASSGFTFQLLARGGQDPLELFSMAMGLTMAANQHPILNRVFTTYTADTPQIFVDVDRTRAEYLKVPVARIFSTLQAHLGSAYVNDFNLGGRTYQVKVQADGPYRDTVADIRDLHVRSNDHQMVPLTSVVTLRTVLGPQLIKRYNQFNSADFNGNAAPGFSSGQAMAAMEQVASEVLTPGFDYEWSALSYQEKTTGGQVVWLFALALVFAYLFLVAQYESWNLPLSIVLSIPVGTLGALAGLWLLEMPLSIYAQIGLVLLVGLTAKNAILIVEFAKGQRLSGLSIAEAAVTGGAIRFRPVLMTSLTFIFGLVPMLVATGAGAGSRRAIGTAVFSGMCVATFLGIFLIPALYYIFQTISEKGRASRNKKQESSI
jgi:hydrophobe/amphiphile efflux-1 (HAE1) family protein